ncbi:hypothetical protein NP493_49g02043 [Ridgeia piscesae]|uniref:S-methyl-5'-thioadenosine phosphorylase n=1 Tax=Ridgeia piscesae TaxID=27915 RepID=A0AAD9PBE6_RIDPI|nr:hypothetical protein NP493_49g02043 [Ridgeia piscesae]
MSGPESSSRPVKIGIIGGTGLDDADIMEQRVEKVVYTPYGKPSDALVAGKIKGVDCILLARHGRNHSINPSNVNYQANIWALKQEGCTHILVTTACGSLQEHFQPGDIVILDQFIDRTNGRATTFYDGSPNAPPGVCHIPMHTPFCPHTREILIETAKDLGIRHHPTGTNITIEGPRFSTKAESKLWKSWGADIINMTTVPEVVLAKESGLCYAALALVTDYDSWRYDDAAQHVSVDIVLATFRENAQRAKTLLLHAIPIIAKREWSQILQDNMKTVEYSFQDQARCSVLPTK